MTAQGGIRSAADRGPRLWSVLLAMPALGLAVLNLVLGWGIGAEVFIRGLADLPAMVPATALCIGGLAMGQLALAVGGAAVHRRVPLFVAAIAVLGVVGFWQSIGGDDRVSPATVLTILLIAVGQVALCVDETWMARVHEYCAGIVIGVASFALVSYVVDLNSLLSVGFFEGLSVPTAMAMVLLAASVLLLRPEGTSLGILIEEGVGGRVARRYLPIAVVVPFVLGYAAQALADLGLLEGRQRRLVVEVLFVLVLGVAVLRLARWQADVANRDLRSRDNLQAILSGLEAAIFVLDRQGGLAGVNGAATRMLGENTQDLNGLLALRMHSVPGRKPMRGGAHPVRQALNGQKDVLAGWLDPTGQEHVLRFSSFLTQGVPGTYRVVEAADVTEPWLLQQTAAQSERVDALTQLVSGISHEMLNVFGVIKLSAGAAKVRGGASSDALDAILRASQRGGDLSERMQKLTLVHNGVVATVDAVEAVQSALLLAQRVLPPSIDLVSDLPSGPTPVTCQGSDLELAVLNLILNARNAIVDAGQTHGRISVAIENDKGDVAIHVRDNGPGIPADILSRVSETFFTTRRSKGGTGLGLATCKTFAENAGGGLVVRSDPGAGAEVVLTLPAAQDREQDQVDVPNDLPDLAGMSLLVADGDEEFLTVLADTLMLLGARVHRTGSAEDAMETARREGAVDVVITDRQLNGPKTGYELARDLRVLLPDIGVIYLAAGWGGRDVVPDVPGLTLAKPVDLAQLGHSVRLVADRNAPSD